jgi:hypothetical protein
MTFIVIVSPFILSVVSAFPTRVSGVFIIQTKMMSNTGLHQPPGVNCRVTPGVNRRITPGMNRRVTPGVSPQVFNC